MDADDPLPEHGGPRADQRTTHDQAGSVPMSSASALPPSPAIGGQCGTRSEAIHLGRRRVPLMVAALCLLLAWGRGRHLSHLLAQGAGDHAAGVAILGNALLLGVLALIAAAAATSVVLGFPRLVVTPQGLTRRSLFRATAAGWDSLSRFHLDRPNGGGAVSAAADIIGLNASRRLRRGGKLFRIANSYRTPVEAIVAEIHDRQTEALGGPAPLPRAASAPVVPRYGAGFRVPWATFALIAILIAAFVVEHRHGVAPEAAPFTPDSLTLYAFGGVNRDAVLSRGELLRVFSSVLLHLSAAHLVGNVAALLLAGWPLERFVGRPWFLAIFVIGGVAGSAVGIAAYPAGMALVGASAGIAGLFGAMAVLSFRLPAGRKRSFVIARTTLVAILMFMPWESGSSIHIGHAAHVGGVLAGAAAGFLLLRGWTPACPLPGFQKAGLAVGAGGLALALLGIPASLRLSREFVASVQGCAGSEPDARIRGCTALLDSGVGNRSATLLNRGRAYLARERYDLAIADLDRVVELTPDATDALLSRGFARFGKKQHDRSIADYDKAIELSPKFAAAYFERGLTFLDEGRVDRAIADEDQAIALDPKLAGAYLVQGLAYSRKGDTGRAISDYSKALALNPGNADAFFHRGSGHLRENRLDEAVADMTKALELRPANAMAYNNRAWALHLKGENALALPDAEKAVALAPSSAPSLETRAEIYEKLGRRRDAVADYRAALAIDGGLQLARDGLKRLGAGPGMP